MHRVLLALAVPLLLAGCGGSSHGNAGPTTAPSAGATTTAAAVIPRDTAGVDITSRAQVGSQHFVAGAAFASAARALGLQCSNGCNPAVWKVVAGRLQPVLLVPATGSIATERLIRLPRGLLLINSDEGTSAWTSPQGTAWQRVALPAAMAADTITYVARTHSGVAVSVVSKAGGRGLTFTSSDGRTWAPR